MTSVKLPEGFSSAEQLIGYCELHCETERALFSGQQVNAMMALAGHAPEDFFDEGTGPSDPRWYTLKEAMRLLCSMARERLDADVQRSRAETRVMQLAAANAGIVRNGLTFNALRVANVQRLPTFKNSKGEQAHAKDDGTDWNPAQWLQAVVGELGEYANFRKKFERGDITQQEFLRVAAKELADVVTYLDLLAYQIGVDLGAATLEKFNEVSTRVGSPIQIASDGQRVLSSESIADGADEVRLSPLSDTYVQELMRKG